ncbi:phosphoinositide 3-kinase adapter protein 1-like [Boleophthalmus pectinirostris]|uniref:phosphoinositide 3-kinase adapter protein 1-like n=1 Tax=Boleophthalmus pectinirostris TaxID=150288 RepID=UPI00242B3E9E|nr:phosphoinositide 3-kinase adapter protein 1-like [Boleophthalmus pectinirostris]
MSRRSSGKKKNMLPKLSTPSSSVLSTIALVPSRVPCGDPVEVFLLLKNESAANVTEVEFSKDNLTVKVQPNQWSDNIVRINAPDFPSGIVKVSVLRNGVTLNNTELLYYSRLEEMSRLLSEVSDPVQFMCQALDVSSVEKLDEMLSSMLQRRMPSGGFQGLERESTPERESHDSEVPTMLHFAAQYGLKSVLSVLLQCPGAERAVRTANRHGHTPIEIAMHHGHTQFHVLLKETRMIDPGEDSANSGVYDEMGAAGSASTANRQKEQRVSDAEEGEEEDPYTEFGVGEIYDTIENPKPSVVIPNRPPAPTPRPQTTEHEGRISSIAKVFLKKKNQGKIGLLPVSTKKAQGHLGTPSSVYDSIVAAPTPGSKQRARASSLPTDNAKDGNNSGPPVQEGAIQQPAEKDRFTKEQADTRKHIEESAILRNKR